MSQLVTYSTLRAISYFGRTFDRPGRYATVSEISAQTEQPIASTIRALWVCGKCELAYRLGQSDKWALTPEGESALIDADRHPALDTGEQSWIWQALTGWLDPVRYPGRVALPTCGSSGSRRPGEATEQSAGTAVRYCVTCGRRVKSGRHTECHQCRGQ